MTTKTTLYLPDELKKLIEAEAARRGTSEADVIRSILSEGFSEVRPRPRGALFASAGKTARESDTHLRGFGER